jgi:hypothetical protein
MRSRNRPGLVNSALARFLPGAKVATLLVPTVLLLICTLRATGTPRIMFGIGCAFQLIVCSLSFLSKRGWQGPIGPSVVTMYLIGFGWLWLSGAPQDDWFPHLTQSVLLIVPLTAFALQVLVNSGAPAFRRAVVLAERLAERKEWPADLSECRNLAEVKAFREALHVDATPALNLLHHPRLGVRVAALYALEFRKKWRRGQAEVVLHVAQRSQDPKLRAAAASALANVDDRLLVEALAEFLKDPLPEVRQATIDALLWDGEGRWSWIRTFIRQHLGDSAFEHDGPLRYDGELPREAIADLHGWAAEKGLLGTRAAQTLGAHYAKKLNEDQDENLMRELMDRVTDPHSPPALRIELAQLLRHCDNWNDEVQVPLLNPANPAMLRLLAVESLLNGQFHVQALAAMHDIARFPNREIALATADVLQRVLSVDLGLPIGQPLPAVHSRQAADVTRRVMFWASRQEQDALQETASV